MFGKDIESTRKTADASELLCQTPKLKNW